MTAQTWLPSDLELEILRSLRNAELSGLSLAGRFGRFPTQSLRALEKRGFIAVTGGSYLTGVWQITVDGLKLVDALRDHASRWRPKQPSWPRLAAR